MKPGGSFIAAGSWGTGKNELASIRSITSILPAHFDIQSVLEPTSSVTPVDFGT